MGTSRGHVCLFRSSAGDGCRLRSGWPLYGLLPIIISRRRGRCAAPLLIFVLDEEGLDLTQKVLGVHGLHQHGLSSFGLPFAAEERIGGKDGDRRVIGCFSGGANYIIYRL